MSTKRNGTSDKWNGIPFRPITPYENVTIASVTSPWPFPVDVIVNHGDDGSDDEDAAPPDVAPLVIRYCFLDDDKNAEKGKVRDACVEWGTWANIEFREDAGLTSFPHALRHPVVAAAKAEAALSAAIETAKRAAITAAQEANVPGAGVSLTAPRASETPRDRNWAALDRSIAALAGMAALTEGGAAQAAQTELEQATETMATAYANANSPDNLPPVIFISILPGERWSYAPCGESQPSLSLALGVMEPMSMYLSLSDIALGDDDTDEKKAKLNYDRGTILHEFGHVLGFQHEHQSPGREGILDFKDGAFETHWRWDTDKSNVVAQTGLQSIVAYSELDQNSIMMYYLPAGTTTLNRVVTRKHELSDLDKAYAMILYPRPVNARPPPAPWAANPPKYAMELIGIPDGHPAWNKILQMYDYLSDPAANIANTEWRGVDPANYQQALRTRNIVQTIRHTLGAWSFSRGAAKRAQLALQDAIKAQDFVEATYRAAEGGQGTEKAKWVGARLRALKPHQGAAEQGQKRA